MTLGQPVLRFVCFVVALVLFGLAALYTPATPRVNLIAAGSFFLTLGFLMA